MDAGHPLAERIEPFKAVAESLLDDARLRHVALAGGRERGHFRILVHGARMPV
jgi:hypothetical protein